MKKYSTRKLVIISVWTALFLHVLPLSSGRLFADSKSNPEGMDLYDSNRILEINIKMDSADWMKLRRQHPDFLSRIQGEEHNPKPYSYFKAIVTIDGTEISEVGVRKKGNLGSVVSTRPSMKLEFDEYNSKKRFQDLEGMTLNNNNQNGAILHQYLSYHLFRKAGVAAPRCNLAHVTVNGEDLGIYSNVEPIKKDFLKRNFGKSGGNVYESGGAFVGKAYRGFNKKNNRKKNDWSDLERVAQALAKPESEILSTLGESMDLEAFYRFWAMDVLVGDWDGYICKANNFYLYNNPETDKLHFIPWGLDAVFEDPGMDIKVTVPRSVKAVSFLPNKLYQIETSRNRYLEVMQQILNDVWNETELALMIETARSLIGDRLHITEAYFNEDLKVIQDFIGSRRKEVQSELDAGSPEWPQSASRKGGGGGFASINSQFNTNWQDRLNKKNTTSFGKADLEISWNGINEKLTQVSVQVGKETNGPRIDYPAISIVGYSAERKGKYGIYLAIDPYEYKANREYTVDFFNVLGVLIQLPEGEIDFHNFKMIGFAMGKLKLKEASSKQGEPVSGELQLQAQLL